jgi:Peptidase family M48
MTETLTLEGRVFDGMSLTPRSAMLTLERELARLHCGGTTLDFPLTGLHVSARVFDAPRFVSLPNSWEFLCAEQPGLARFASRGRTEGAVSWLERRLTVAVGAVFGTLAGVAWFYFFGVPRLAEAVATHVSRERERALGERALAAFDRAGSETDLDDETVEEVRLGFERLERGLPRGVGAELEFRDAPRIGPNAFALPGGIIVVTDQLVTTCSVDESIAVLAHELGHVEYRHPLKFVLQEFGVAALGSLFGDGSNLTLSASSLPLVLADAKYSRRFEEEADAEGFALAARAGYSPELFATCLAKLDKKAAKSEGPFKSYLSTHPADADRIARAHGAARDFQPSRSKAPH